MIPRPKPGCPKGWPFRWWHGIAVALTSSAEARGTTIGRMCFQKWLVLKGESWTSNEFSKAFGYLLEYLARVQWGSGWDVWSLRVKTLLLMVVGKFAQWGHSQQTLGKSTFLPTTPSVVPFLTCQPGDTLQDWSNAQEIHHDPCGNSWNYVNISRIDMAHMIFLWIEDLTDPTRGMVRNFGRLQLIHDMTSTTRWAHQR